MSPRKPPPYRLGYKSEYPYPNKGGAILPSHGYGPRCKVDYNPNDDGPLTTLRIMRIDENDVVEDYSCAMPRYYAIPLTLINKQLAFYEAQCHPDGTPLPPSSSCGIKLRELRDYSYLWHLRCRFLQAVFEMNHERLLNERWRYDGIHGFLHRMYRRFGHDKYQRFVYWRGEIKEGRMPYTAPDIAEMDWDAYLVEDMATSTRINAFLWNRVSQGYTREVKDEPPFESWRAWRAGHKNHKPVPYLTPASSPVRELPSERDGVSTASAAVAVAEIATQGSSSGCGARRYDTTADDRTVTAPPTLAAAGAGSITSSSSGTTVTSYSECAAAGSRRGVGVVAGVVTGNGSGDCRWAEEEVEEELEYEEVAVLTTVLTGPPNSQEWALPFSSFGSQQSQLSASQGTSQSMSTSANGQERFRQRQISFKFNAPEDMELAVIKCTFARAEDVKNFKTELKIDYAKDPS